MDEKGSAQGRGQGQQLVQLLLQTATFDHFNVRQVQPLLKSTRARTVRVGEPLWHPGDQPQALYILLQGAMSVVPRGAKAQRMEPVAVLGDVELVAGLPYASEAAAATASLLLEVPAAHVESLLDTDTAFCQRLCRNITAMLAGQLQQANERLGALTKRRGETDQELERARMDLNDQNLIRQLRENRGV